MRPVEQRRSAQATKVLFALRDGRRIETVRMRYARGYRALCISSQAGCALACRFCATGAVGLKRQLTADEIVDQVRYFLQRGDRFKSISFMGMGEPLANPSTFLALRVLTDPALIGLGPRRLSVSTVGVIPGIERLTRELPHVNLAFSLHSPFSEQRNHLVPLNRRYPIEDVMAVLDRHVHSSRRKVFIAYLLLEGHNDSPAHAAALIDLLRYNPASAAPGAFQRTASSTVRRFADALRRGGLAVTARQSFG